ncbi:MAG: nucleotidyltransferase family protein [Hyphomicrobiales bacterium]|nr:nucleotidyltransferase family protein [Hyphomicrobiales bacterium]MCP5370394.1 nucleotidyltransferase family protein [Hyphomicrobiales bacterium]
MPGRRAAVEVTNRAAPPAGLPRHAMVMAAGFGRRMRPITNTLPKPLIEVAGRSLLDRAIDRLADAGVENVVVNTHHLGHLIEQHVRHRKDPKIRVSPEPNQILDTGGGVANALPMLGDGPFFVVNGDSMWLDGYEPALWRMWRQWDDANMDALLLANSTVTAFGYTGRGDFLMDPLGRVSRRHECEDSPYLFTGIQILHPRLFEGCPDGAFSLNVLYNKAGEAGRLFGLVHDGEWFHVGTPDGLAEAESYLTERWPESRRR